MTLMTAMMVMISNDDVDDGDMIRTMMHCCLDILIPPAHVPYHMGDVASCIDCIHYAPYYAWRRRVFILVFKRHEHARLRSSQLGGVRRVSLGNAGSLRERIRGCWGGCSLDIVLARGVECEIYVFIVVLWEKKVGGGVGRTKSFLGRGGR